MLQTRSPRTVCPFPSFPARSAWRSPYAIRPIDALRAMWRLMRDPGDTAQGARLVEAIEGRAPLRMLARARETAAGRALLEEKPDLLSRLRDAEALAALPEGTLGRSYCEFCRREGITPGGLDDAVRDGLSRERATRMSEDARFLADWQRDSHDLVHVVAGCDTTVRGETLVLLRVAVQTGNPAFWSLVVTGLLLLLARLQLRPREIGWTIRRARSAVHIPTVDWTALLDKPLEQVRGITRI